MGRLPGCLFVLAMTLPPFGAFADDVEPRTDLMTFAQGVLPVAVTAGPTDLRTDLSHALAAIDGNPSVRGATPKPGGPDETVEMVFAMPAPTRFDGFAVPNVLETPSPSQTFFGRVEIDGSSVSADGPFVPLAAATLAPHEERGQVTDLALVSQGPPVLWVRMRLSGGLNVETEKTFFEFSEIVGTGAQDPAPMSTGFSGVWKGRGVDIELAQDGATVTGCYDGQSRLSGTVSGNVLRALGENDAGIPSQFILIADQDGALHGLRSTNGAPFKPYDGEATGTEPVCLAPEPAVLGCGAVVHGIGFEFDSDAIRPGSEQLIAEIHRGLSDASAAKIEIVGHSSSEGPDDYNRDLSQRRAQSVVAALVALGLDAERISASGRGEDEPIASNDDEAGRSLNRRVEVICAG